ncbi:unnamed protein product, partial [marine sediment metagenome]
MKIKNFIILGLSLFMVVSLPLNVRANAKFSITDVEYLKGEDFIQLHFIANDIIPIPDLFYPYEDNSKLIIMRITNVEFKPAKNNFKFESPVIDTVKITKSKKFVDVKIKLKEKVNYRVFTNREGLYIEFPNVKRVSANTKTANKKTHLAKKRKNEKKEVKPTLPALPVEKKKRAEVTIEKNVFLK